MSKRDLMDSSVGLSGTGRVVVTRSRQYRDYRNSEVDQGLARTPFYHHRFDVFNMSNEKDLALYQKIVECHGFGVVSIISEKDYFDEVAGDIKLSVRWVIAAEAEPGELAKFKSEAYASLRQLKNDVGIQSTERKQTDHDDEEE